MIFSINGKTYQSKKMGYNFMATLDENGIELGKAGNFALMRVYLAYCGDMSLEAAGDELEAHMIADGDFAGYSKAIDSEMNNSAFFRKLQGIEETPAEETAEEPKKTSTRKKKTEE